MDEFNRIKGKMNSQWVGIGSVPGMNLGLSACCYNKKTMVCLRPLTVPGRGVGPHGFDSEAGNSAPNVCSDYPLIYNVADRDVEEDPMDSKYMWTVPTSGTRYAIDPYQRWVTL